MSGDRSRLDPRRRPEIRQALGGRDFDIVVVGGGVTGCGVALDAAARGLSVALVEADDLAGGSSSSSAKLFQGWLRTVGRYDINLIRDTLRERDLMVERLCPHLVRPEPFLVPLDKPWDRVTIGAGAAWYDLLRLTRPRFGRHRTVPWHEHHGRARTLAEFPSLREDEVRGSVRYVDVSVDDARHTLLVARTAASMGAMIATRTRVVGVVRSAGRIRGVRTRDVDTGEELDVSAQVVINATGVWADRLQQLAGGRAVAVTPAKSVHLVVPGDRIAGRTGLVARAHDGWLLMRRWMDSWLLGTTDTRWDLDVGPEAGVTVTGQDVRHVLSHVNRWLAEPLGQDDLLGVCAGLRPLVTVGRTSAGQQPATSQRHGPAVVEDPIGLVTVVGGTYPTYRLMAREAVDLAVRRFRRRIPRSSTEQIPILGASGFRVLRGVRAEVAATVPALEPWMDHLLGRYGSLSTELFDLVDERPELARPLPGGHGLAAEVVYAVRAEGALHLPDVLARRTRVALEAPDGGSSDVAPVAAELMAAELGWSDDRRSEELDRYRKLVAADRAALLAPNDAAAVAARRAVLDRP